MNPDVTGIMRDEDTAAEEGGQKVRSLYLLKTSSTSSNEPYNRQGWSRL